MCIATVNACNRTTQNQFTPAGAGRFAFMGCGFEPVTMVTKVVENQVGIVTTVNKEHGYIAYNLPTPLLELTLTKNGAPSLPQNTKLFFHESQLSMNIKNLTIGTLMAFDVYHYKSTNKLIAHSVHKTTSQEHEAQRFNLASFLPVAKAPSVVTLGKGKHATVVSLGNGFGYIKYLLNKIPFHESKLEGCSFGDLRVNCVVKFDLKERFGKKVAENVEFVEYGTEPQKMVGYFMDCSEGVVDELVCKEATGKITNIQNHIATTKYEDKLVTFTENNLFDTALHLLSIGDDIKFDVYSKNSNLFAKTVEKSAPSTKDMLLGHFQFVDTNLLPTKNTIVKKGVIVSVIEIIKEGGFIDFEGLRVYFPASELRGLHVLELETNTLLRCDVEQTTNKKLIATNLTKDDLPKINIVNSPDTLKSGKDTPTSCNSLVGSRRQSRILGFGKRGNAVENIDLGSNIVGFVNRNR